MIIRTAAVSLAWACFLAAADKPVSFSKDIQPVLESSCLKCHGATAKLSKLDLQTREIREWINQGAPWEAMQAIKDGAASQLPGTEEMPILPEARQYWRFRSRSGGRFR